MKNPKQCAHLLPQTGERVRCPSCKGEVMLKLFGCAVYGKCTPGKEVPGYASCRTCPDYAPVKEDPGPRREGAS